MLKFNSFSNFRAAIHEYIYRNIRAIVFTRRANLISIIKSFKNRAPKSVLLSITMAVCLAVSPHSAFHWRTRPSGRPRNAGRVCIESESGHAFAVRFGKSIFHSLHHKRSRWLRRVQPWSDYILFDVFIATAERKLSRAHTHRQNIDLFLLLNDDDEDDHGCCWLQLSLSPRPNAVQNETYAWNGISFFFIFHTITYLFLSMILWWMCRESAHTEPTNTIWLANTNRFRQWQPLQAVMSYHWMEWNIQRLRRCVCARVSAQKRWEYARSWLSFPWKRIDDSTFFFLIFGSMLCAALSMEYCTQNCVESSIFFDFFFAHREKKWRRFSTLIRAQHCTSLHRRQSLCKNGRIQNCLRLLLLVPN